MGVLELVNCNKNQIILKVNAKDPLTVAINPGFSSKMAYITVTRGSNHILTVTNEDGTNWSFSWGSNGHTLISDSVERLKQTVIDFIVKECHIPYGLTGKPIEAKAFYNTYFRSWQLTLSDGRDNMPMWYEEAKGIEDIKEIAKDFVNPVDWNYSVSSTNCEVWKAVL